MSAKGEEEKKIKNSVEESHAATVADRLDVDSPQEQSGFAAYTRIFKYGSSIDYMLQGIAIAAAVVSGAGIALQNLIFGEFITILTQFTSGESAPGQFREDAAELALYFVYLGIGRFILSYIYNTLLTYTSYRITRNIRHHYLKAALSQEIAFFDIGSGGSIATQATSNGRLIQGGISEKFGLTFQGLSSFITAFIIAFVAQWKLTLICLCIAPATLIVNGAAAGMMAGYETRMLEIFAQSNSFAEGILSSARTISAFGMHQNLVGNFDSYLIDAHNVGKKISPLFGILFSSEYCIIYLGYGLAFWQGIRMLARGEIHNAGTIFTVLLSVIIAATSLTTLAPYSIDFTRATAAAAKLFDLIDRKSQIDPFNTNGKQPVETIGNIELQDITFAYPTRPGVTILNKFSLKIPAGKVTALVGQSGSGKSTIIGLIERWYNVQSGSITLDGCPIQELNLSWLRRNVRLVQQEPVLFQGSVFDNIKHGLVGTQWANVTRQEQMERIQEACKIAFAHDFISGLPNGYDTEIGQRGGLLSGGQKQRIAIARSIVSQPKILLLDEATSALDPNAEGIVQQALDKASEGRTTVVIAHKLVTIRKADNIVVMAKGKIIEAGSHEVLMAKGEAYARLVQIQNLNVPEAVSPDDIVVEETPNSKLESLDLTRTATQYAVSVDQRMETQKERDNYDHHGQQGILNVITRLIRLTPELAWTYFIVFAGCVLAGATFPGQAILLAHIMEIFPLQGREMEDKGSFYATMYIVLAVGCFIAYFALGYATNVVAQQLSHKLRKLGLHHMLRQDLQFFDRTENNAGALTSRVDSNPQSVLELMGYNIGLILVAVFNISACSILAIVYSWKFGLVVVCAGLPPLVTAGYLKIRFDAKLDRDVSKRYSASASIASEAITAIRTVSSLTIEESVLEKYTEELDQAVAHSKKPLFTLMLCFAFTQAIEYWFMALGFWYGCRLLSFGEISPYAFFVAFMGVFYSGQSAAQLFQFSTSITKGINAANYIFWLEELQPTIQETPENRDNTPSSGDAIDMNNLRFSYPLRPETTVLKGVDLEIRRGQFVAFVGASGCGKSTMIALLERFYDPSSGAINIDSVSLTTLNPHAFRRLVTLVQQEPTLFQGTIRENVALGVSDSDIDTAASDFNGRIEEALRAANAWDFVSSLPEGLATDVGSSGAQLSGRQKQRIAIARALIRKPKILLLDEATSALDTESEKIVQGALARAAMESDRITIAVAHRLSTVKDADLICVFYRGKIAEMGMHKDLLAQGGMYSKMCEAQSLE
ncbi:multidrug resistance protein [Aaosphaeria arxii CBS 175.79]|uniref:Multidrug resistance protein n=1 Tax=Aaosphaeria arxii CBS 175.79 TaxID=1450172 RepID=A0A6A5XDS0_9PLEO|nr:multidrug resistance protein [Aaosphaeria arxii CBS 175.79]KAF2010914.1 multidrug resistance protein [Aaosphaeria arxii CBS 175.79]